MHLDFIHPITAAGFAASTFDIKAKAPRLVTTQLGLIGLAEQLADKIKYSGIGGRIGTRRSADR